MSVTTSSHTHSPHPMRIRAGARRSQAEERAAHSAPELEFQSMFQAYRSRTSEEPKAEAVEPRLKEGLFVSRQAQTNFRSRGFSAFLLVAAALFPSVVFAEGQAGEQERRTAAEHFGLVSGGEPLSLLREPAWLKFSELSAVALDASGGRVAVGDAEGNLRIFDAQSGAELRRFKAASAVAELGFIGSEGLVAALENGTLLRFSSGAAGAVTLNRRSMGALAVANARDGSEARFAAATRQGLALWTVPLSPEGDQAEGSNDDPDSVLLKGFSGLPSVMAFDPQLSVLAAGGEGGALWLWSMAALDAEPRRIDTAPGTIRRLTFSASGREIAMSGAAGHVQIVSAESGALKVEGHFRALPVALRFIHDDRVLLGVLPDGSVQLLDTATARELEPRYGSAADALHSALAGPLPWPPSAEKGRVVFATGFSPDGELAAVMGADRVLLFQPRTFEPTLELSSGPSSIDFIEVGPQGSILLGARDGSARILAWNEGPQLLPLFSHRAGGAPVWMTAGEGKVVLSRDGLSLYTLEPNLSGVDQGAGGSVAQGLRQELLSRFSEPIRALAASPDGSLLAVVSGDGLQVLDLSSGKRVASVDLRVALAVDEDVLAPRPSRLSLAYTDGGERLLVLTEGGLWHAMGDLDRGLSRLDAAGSPSVVAAGQQRFASASGRSLRIWDARSADGVDQLDFRGENIGALHFLSDQRLLVGFASGRVSLVNWEGERRTQTDWLRSERGLSGVRGLASLELRGEKNQSEAADSTPGFALLRDDGSVEVFGQPADEGELAGLELSLQQGIGGWLAKGNERFFRGDDGSFIRLLRSEGRLEAALPSPEKEPDLQATVVQTTAVTEGTAPGLLKLRISNSPDAGPAYWLRVVASQKPEELSVVLPPTQLRLDPGMSIELPVRVFANSREPLPRSVNLEFTLQHSQGEGVKVPARMELRSARIQLEKVLLEGREPERLAKATVVNIGNAHSPELLLELAFFLQGREVESGPVLQLEPLAPGQSAVLAVNVPQMEEEGLELVLRARDDSWPGVSWESRAAVGRMATGGWMAIAGAVLLLLLVLAVVWWLRREHPLVTALLQNPAGVRDLDLKRFPEFDKALQSARKRELFLSSAGIASDSWKRVVELASQPETANQAFADTLDARLSSQIARLDAFKLEMPALPIHLGENQVVATFQGEELKTSEVSLFVRELERAGLSRALVFALDFTAAQNVNEVLSRQIPTLVTLSLRQFKTLLLHSEPQRFFLELVAGQRSLSDISPYRSAGGVESESFFFGRGKELRTITERGLSNYLVVGPRQMGKSSLLKAIRRKLTSRLDVEVRYLSLFEDDLASAVARAVDQPRPESVEDFLPLAAGSKQRPVLWLIDEADSFIIADSKKGYPLSQAMRLLSEEGLAYFVLAGYWHLYAAAALNPNNPLRNFGEIIRMGPLDRDAAKALITRPMEAMGLEFESPLLVERLLDETACRAHLLVAAGRKIIDLVEEMGPPPSPVSPSIPEAGAGTSEEKSAQSPSGKKSKGGKSKKVPKKSGVQVENSLEDVGVDAESGEARSKPAARPISAKMVEQALYRNPLMGDEFKTWRRDPLNRAMLRAALMGEAPTRAQLRERLDSVGISPSADLFGATLDRLELSYFLVAGEEGRLRCPVPLLRRMIEEEEDLAKGLARDAKDFLQASKPAA